VDVLRDPAAPPFYVARKVRVLDVPTQHPEITSALNVRLLWWGYLNGLAVLPDRIVVSTFGGTFSQSQCVAPDGTNTGTVVGPEPSASELHFFDPETLAPLGTSTSGLPCTALIEADPAGGFVALAGKRYSTTTFERFSAHGTQISTAARTLDPPGFSPADLLLVPGTRIFAALLISDNDAAVTTIDLATGTSSTVDLGKVTGAVKVEAFALAPYAEGGRTLIAITDTTGPQILLIDPTAPDHIVAQIADPAVRNTHYHQLVYVDPPIGRFVFTDASADLLWSTSRADPRLTFFNPHFSRATPTALSRGRAKDALLAGWVSQNVSRDWAAYATVIDAAAPRVLPGAIELGEGSVGSIRSDGKGRFFVALPWSAELVRIDPN
jgi:hypothetical protein